MAAGKCAKDVNNGGRLPGWLGVWPRDPLVAGARLGHAPCPHHRCRRAALGLLWAAHSDAGLSGHGTSSRAEPPRVSALKSPRAARAEPQATCLAGLARPSAQAVAQQQGSAVRARAPSAWAFLMPPEPQQGWTEPPS